jgi:hypothetical protein
MTDLAVGVTVLVGLRNPRVDVGARRDGVQEEIRRIIITPRITLRLFQKQSALPPMNPTEEKGGIGDSRLLRAHKPLLSRFMCK